MEIYAACSLADPPARPAIGGVAEMLRDDLQGEGRWSVPRDSLINIQTLGSGQFGEVPWRRCVAYCATDRMLVFAVNNARRYVLFFF